MNFEFVHDENDSKDLFYFTYPSSGLRQLSGLGMPDMAELAEARLALL